jgi:hypothetical protein
MFNMLNEPTDIRYRGEFGPIDSGHVT